MFALGKDCYATIGPDCGITFFYEISPNDALGTCLLK